MEQDTNTTNAAETRDEQTQSQTGEQAQDTQEGTEGANANAKDTELERSSTDAVEIAILKREISRLNNKADLLASENARQKEQLNSYKSAEQIQKEQHEEEEKATKEKVKELEKELSIIQIAKSAMAVINDDARATNFANMLHGAENPNGVIAEIKKLLSDQEKSLKIKFGKIPAPSVGEGNGPTYTREQLLRMKGTEISLFKKEHPDEYVRIMGKR